MLGSLLWNILYDRLLKLNLLGVSRLVAFADVVALLIVATHLDVIEALQYGKQADE